MSLKGAGKGQSRKSRKEARNFNVKESNPNAPWGREVSRIILDIIIWISIDGLLRREYISCQVILPR